MNVLDVNVVVSLYRPDHELHRAATTWWEASVGRGDVFTVPDLVWAGFVRTVTNSRVFPTTASVEESWRFAQALMAQPTYVTWVGDPRTLEHFALLCREANAKANMVTDAYIAACASAYGGTVVTFDRDFRKFDGLRVTELSA